MGGSRLWTGEKMEAEVDWEMQWNGDGGCAFCGVKKSKSLYFGGFVPSK